VTNLAYLRRSDAVMAQFLSIGVILRRVVYRYAENRCKNKYTGEEREAVNALIGKIGKYYKVMAEAIEKYRESDSGNELMTNLEILVEIASSLKKVKSSQELLLGTRSFWNCQNRLIQSMSLSMSTT
jgi:hypothetical protein